MAASVTKRLHSVVANGDVNGTMNCLRAYVYDVSVGPSDRAPAVDAILAAVITFARDANVVGGCLCALSHVSPSRVHVGEVLKAVRPFQQSHPIVLQAAARLLFLHVQSPRAMEDLPRLAETTAKWMQMHPLDRNVSYYGARILITCAGHEPDDVKTEHGSCGVHSLDVAVVKGAAATRLAEVDIHGEVWSAYVLRNLYPRLRARA